MENDRIRFVVTDRMIRKMNTIWSILYQRRESVLPDFARDLGVSVEVLDRLLGRKPSGDGEIVGVRLDFCTFAGVDRNWLLLGDPASYAKQGRIPVLWVANPEGRSMVSVCLVNRTPHRLIHMSRDSFEYRRDNETLAEYLEGIHIRLGNVPGLEGPYED